jgi:apolipoprotein N-acyltransferase
MAGVVGLAVWIGLGVLRLDTPAPASPGLSVILVQGNIPEGEKQDRQIAVANFTHYLTLTARGVAASTGPHVVVWPETASPFLLATDAAARAAIASVSAGPALIGSVRFSPEPARPVEEVPRNSLIAISPTGAVAGIVDKWHLVPFGEYQPDWLPGIQIVPGGGFHPGPGPRSLHVAGMQAVGVLICYEAIFPGQAVDEADRPDWLVNVTNDAWFGNSSGPRQHLAAARMRAVEEGLPLMRAANTGITAGFDGFGRELEHLPMGEDGFLTLTLPGHLPPPLFSRIGLIIPAALAIGVCGFPWLMPVRDPRTVRRGRRN